MSKPVIISLPETVVWGGVELPLAAAAFGVVGILIGHWIAPAIGTPLPAHKQIGVVVGGIVMIAAIAIAVGQKPWLVGAWGFGLGFSGITIFRTIGAQTRQGMKTIGDLVIEKLEGLDDDKDDTK